MARWIPSRRLSNSSMRPNWTPTLVRELAILLPISSPTIRSSLSPSTRMLCLLLLAQSKLTISHSCRSRHRSSSPLPPPSPRAPPPGPRSRRTKCLRQAQRRLHRGDQRRPAKRLRHNLDIAGTLRATRDPARRRCFRSEQVQDRVGRRHWSYTLLRRELGAEGARGDDCGGDEPVGCCCKRDPRQSGALDQGGDCV